LQAKKPYFSIITPMYNRGNLIGRTINSCLSQDFPDFEVIVVDDGSTDDSREVVKAYADPRVKLICHATNRGQCAARNTGVEVAQGDWIIYLDSDDELIPGALTTIYQRIREVGDNIDIIRLMCRLDSQELSPAPPLRGDVWDYAGFIDFVVRSRLQDTLCVVSRDTFLKVRWPDEHLPTSIYHYDMAKHFLTQTFPDVVLGTHQDAGAQMTTPDVSRLLQRAPYYARGIESILARHGAALANLAPPLYEQVLAGAATYWFLSGQRSKALKYIAQSLRLAPLSPRPWTILLSGLVSPRLLAKLKIVRQRRLGFRTKVISRESPAEA
jgi:hypothetical protein